MVVMAGHLSDLKMTLPLPACRRLDRFPRRPLPLQSSSPRSAFVGRTVTFFARCSYIVHTTVALRCAVHRSFFGQSLPARTTRDRNQVPVAVLASADNRLRVPPFAMSALDGGPRPLWPVSLQCSFGGANSRGLERSNSAKTTAATPRVLPLEGATPCQPPRGTRIRHAPETVGREGRARRGRASGETHWQRGAGGGGLTAPEAAGGSSGVRGGVIARLAAAGTRSVGLFSHSAFHSPPGASALSLPPNQLSRQSCRQHDSGGAQLAFGWPGRPRAWAGIGSAWPGRAGGPRKEARATTRAPPPHGPHGPH